MSEAPTHIYAYRDGYYPYWTTDPDLHRDAAQYIRADIAVGAAVAVKNHLADQQWISVEERLPEDDEVLVYEKDQWGYDIWGVDSYSPIQRRWLNDSTPTHWMPLPPPPPVAEKGQPHDRYTRDR